MTATKIKGFLQKPVHLAPLAIFRMVFGAILFLSVLRFMAKGWVRELYVEPKMFFPYYGFEWIKPLGETGMYVLFALMALAFLFVSLGLFYRTSSCFAFLSFSYIELIDKSNYLNHYYFVSLVCLLLIFAPANRYFSLDAWRKPELHKTHAANWTIWMFKFQLILVYFFAGLAKLNYDWMIEALPLKIWLPSKSNLPLIGGLLNKEWLAYLFSWFGALYDLSIPIFLLFARTRSVAYFFVLVFHIMTWILFPIGMFPFIMIGATLIFFSSDFHHGIIQKIQSLLKIKPKKLADSTWQLAALKGKVLMPFIVLFFLLQSLLPMRYLLYPGNLYWTEQGYRFSWRVMLMEKAAYVIFHITDPDSGKSWEVNNYDFLSPNQEKMMSTQPDMILQFAHHLSRHYKREGIQNPIVNAEAYASLNGSISKQFIDPTIDLSQVEESFENKNWILPEPGKH